MSATLRQDEIDLTSPQNTIDPNLPQATIDLVASVRKVLNTTPKPPYITTSPSGRHVYDIELGDFHTISEHLLRVLGTTVRYFIVRRAFISILISLDEI
jgi:hypothetical protein